MVCGGCRHAEVGCGRLCGADGSVEAGEFGLGCFEAVLESFDFAEPGVGSGFVDAGGEVDGYLFEAAALGGVDAEHGAADAPLTDLVSTFPQVMTGFSGSGANVRP